MKPFNKTFFGLNIFNKGIFGYNLDGAIGRDAWMKRLIKQKKHRVFRRIYLKRRETNGEYEDNWQLVDSSRIKNFGSISYSVDEVIPNFYKIGDLSFSVFNGDGFFSDESDDNSFWYDYLGLDRTFIKIEAGYIDSNTGIEYPTNSTLYIGLFGSDLSYQDNNIVSFNTKNIATIFDEFPADRITGLGTTQTASDIVGKIRDYLDGNSISVFQKYISEWNIEDTTQYYNMATTTSLQNVSCWNLIQKLATAENFVTYIGKEGDFNFKPVTSVTTTSFRFSGIGDTDKTYGHNIIGNMKVDTNIRKVYNRVSVKFDNAETTTSYYIKNESWNWGESVSSFYYGIRDYKYTNEFLVSSTALTVANTIYDEFKWPKKNITFKSKFVPHLMVQDTAIVSYKTRKDLSSDYLWGNFIWRDGFWGYRAGYNLELDSLTARIVKIKLNVDNFSTDITLREI